MKNVMSLVIALGDTNGVDYIQKMRDEAKADRMALRKFLRSDVVLTDEDATKLLTHYDRLGLLIVELESLQLNKQSDMQYSVEDEDGMLVQHNMGKWNFLEE